MMPIKVLFISNKTLKAFRFPNYLQNNKQLNQKSNQSKLKKQMKYSNKLTNSSGAPSKR
jgi:hypothetical protein